MVDVAVNALTDTTWTNGATTYSAIKMDVTDTASAAASKLLDLQVGSVEKFTISKAGAVLVGSWTGTAISTQYGGTGQDFSASTGIVKVTSGTASVITDNSTNWDTAYGWGDHASGGYLTSITGLAPDTATTAAAQPNITSLGTLTTLTVDDITINGNTISSAGASTLAITPTAGQSITFDGTVTLDGGVIAGATSITSTAFSGDLTGNVTGNVSGTAATVTGAAQTAITSLGTLTALQVDNINVNGNAITSTDVNGDITITPNGTGSIILDGMSWPQADGTADYVLKTDGAGQLSWTAQTGGSSAFNDLSDVTITTPATGAIVTYNGSAWVNIAAGSAGQYLEGGSTPSWSTPAGSGDVVKVGTPVSGQMGVWTGDGTLGDATDISTNLNIDVVAAGIEIYEAANDGNPGIAIGATSAERLLIQPVYDGAAQTLDYVNFQTFAASATADKGLFRFTVDETAILDIDDGGITLSTGVFTGNLTGDVTGNVSGTAATVTGAAQAAITSLGTLTTLTVDDITINGNTISSAGASTLAITPTAGQAITFDGTITLDGGVIAGATSITSTAFSGDLTGNVTGNVSGTAATVTGAAQTAITSVGTLTALQVDNININGNTISSTAGTDLLITPLAGQQIVLDGTIVVDAGVVTGATSITSTAFSGDLTGNVTGNVSGTAATVTGAAQAAITSLGTLTTLDVDNININGNAITSTDVNGNITITPNGTGSIVLDGLSWPQADGTADYVLKTDGAGQLSWVAQGGISGSGTDNYVVLWNGTGAIDGSADFTTSSGQMTVGASTNANGLLLFGGNTGDAQGPGIKPSGSGNVAPLIQSIGVASIDILRDDSNNSSVQDVLRVMKRTTGSPGAGHGASIVFDVETASNNHEKGARIQAVTTDVTSTQEDFDFIFLLMEAGATAAERARLTSAGNFSVTGRFLVPSSSVASPALAFTTDLNTGIYRDTADNIGFSAGGVAGIRYDGDGTDVLALHQADVGITASATQTQGQQPLVSSFNEVSTVTTTNDVVTLPTAAAFLWVTVINNGANTLQIFPATGDNIDGLGVNTSTTLAAGDSVTFFAIDATNWDMIATTATGGGTPTAITVADESADTTCFPLFVTAATGDLGPKTASGLTFDATTDVLTAAGFSGPLTGNVTGNVTGTAATVTSATQTAITTLANLTSIQGVTVTLADAGADAFLGWDDTAGAYENLTQSEALDILGLNTTDSPQFATIELGHATDTTITRDAAGIISVQGTKVRLAGTETIWQPASGMYADTAAPAAEGSVQGSNGVMRQTFDFDDATDEKVQFSIAMPKGWNEGTVSVVFEWTANATSGDVIWAVEAVAVGDDDALDATFGTAATATDTMKGTAYDLATSPAATLTIGGTPAEEDVCFFRVYRDANAGGDTLTGDAMLLGVKITYTTNAANDD